MRGSTFFATVASFLWAFGPSARAEGERPELKAKAGDVAAYTVKRSSSNEGRTASGDFKQSDESEVQYRIEVQERKPDGSLVLKVAYASVKAKGEGRDGPWEFDSAKKEGGDENAAAIREAISKPATVTVAGGKVEKIAGLPEAQRGEGDRGRRSRASRLAGSRALERDLELILSSPVQGQSLEKGKEYKKTREKSSSAEEEGKAKRGRFRMEEPVVIYKYQGDEKVDGQPACKFSLAVEPSRARSGDDSGGAQQKVEGTALVSGADGLLLSLDLNTETKRDGQTTSFNRRTRISIARGKPDRPKAEL